MDEPLKRCTRCGKEQARTEFYRHPYSPDRLTYHCRSCVREYSKRSCAISGDKRRATARKWNEENPRMVGDNQRVCNSNRRAERAGAPGRLKRADWEALLARFSGKCLACGSDQDLGIDHVIPFAEGGTNTPDNLQLLCRGCNTRKYNRAMDYRPGAPPELDPARAPARRRRPPAPQ